MAQQSNNNIGQACACGYRFSRGSYVGSIITRENVEGRLVIRRQRVCRECHDKHFEEGE